MRVGFDITYNQSVIYVQNIPYCGSVNTTQVCYNQ